jgi:hypothetical protein
MQQNKRHGKMFSINSFTSWNISFHRKEKTQINRGILVVVGGSNPTCSTFYIQASRQY